MSHRNAPTGMIERPDGSQIPYDKLEPAMQLEHDLVLQYCIQAETAQETLSSLKRKAIEGMKAARKRMLDEYSVKKGGADGNMSLRSACGRYMLKLTVSKHVTFGPELEAAKVLIDEFLESEMEKGGSEAIRDIVTKVFKIKAKGRVDTSGILGLREHRFEDPRWERAMKAVEDAIRKDSSTTYVNFYAVDPSKKPGEDGAETRIALDIAKL